MYTEYQLVFIRNDYFPYHDLKGYISVMYTQINKCVNMHVYNLYKNIYICILTSRSIVFDVWLHWDMIYTSGDRNYSSWQWTLCTLIEHRCLRCWYGHDSHCTVIVYKNIQHQLLSITDICIVLTPFSAFINL